MRRRILYTMIAMLLAVGAALGIPLSVIAWWWVADSAHQTLDSRLKSISDQLIRTDDGRDATLDPALLDSPPLRSLIPDQGRLILTYVAPDGHSATRAVGAEIDGATISDSIGLGDAGSLILEIPRNDVRGDQLAAVGIVTIVVASSLAAGTVVAAVTAGRIADPVIDLAHRATAMARGDFRSEWRTYGIVELDRVSRALGDANTEIALRLEREGEIVGDVSHQLRSRLTAIQLRLDELSLHDDPAVVGEAEAALDQVERLSGELDEMVAASRDDPAPMQSIDVTELLTRLVGDFENAFAAQGREVTVAFSGPVCALSAQPGRLREAVSVLVDNALQHGAGQCRIDVGELAGDMVRITVADEGKGVADDIAQSIFRRGFSAGSGTGRAGTGVGLSLARALVEADGGRLELAHRRPPVFSIVVPSAAQGSETTDGSGGHLRHDRVPHR
ncbi:HAMP domain-containing histidine kinase [Gordonia polyisoprenivorans]|uniref:sensor histidine kinase n=1 Tax=Gordonia polyisoprenivorans TaxID=84595 RepID=UPI001B8CA302|nr:HAMP domain-containing sensor histidine kinase [Gordonia polyisoprenivorans]QUD81077.1 HAMP domain-containing histidine kinase [Gordonia polyisoprenivorans]